MTHTYNITNMTCEGCVAKVSHLLKQLPEVTGVTVNLAQGTADVTMSSHISTPKLQEALKDYPKYQLSEKAGHHHMAAAPAPGTDVFGNPVAEPAKSWVQIYRPILLIAGYITVASTIAATAAGAFNGMAFMRVFMAGFFLTFSFFKMLDLRGFAESYAMYDIVAKKIPAWGYIYAFLELGLGLAFATNWQPVFTNAFTAVLMSVSLVGVLQSVLSKKTIRCACLGAVFNLPMSTVTIIEDGLMILMSVAMLAMYL
ncbi:heavy metal transporter [Flavobacterium akiainvivens]|uniref:Heavy metal transporter n=1 Tax=Flavobacterium akiainvivens TaxID=1202724 RepID=A0A0M8MFM4_9FLAO|nr:heavy metal-associated domain-containing protein [Flavobacterium akiainvivens]KOS04777.1 heavy metal transporter [Flavobacterium akiainvivens]SFQ66383.1 Copper chaperone CopZ [Flavobacterium akiainvivens]